MVKILNFKRKIIKYFVSTYLKKGETTFIPIGREEGRYLNKILLSKYFYSENYLGIGLLYFSNQVLEVTYDYTECKENTVSSATPRQCSAVLTDNPGLPIIRAKTEIMGGGD